MRAQNNNLSPRIPLNEQFHRLSLGMASITEILHEQARARKLMLEHEDNYMRRRRCQAELGDPYSGGYCH